jgi:primosomal protein N' (replication factor Y)
VKHDYEQFYREEIVFREALKYPPFSYLANIIATTDSYDGAGIAIDAVANAVRTVADPNLIQLLGPVAAPIAKLQNRYRRHLLLKAPDANVLGATLEEAMKQLDESVTDTLTLDVDPQSLL